MGLGTSSLFTAETPRKSKSGFWGASNRTLSNCCFFTAETQDLLPAGEQIRIMKGSHKADAATLQQRLRLFEKATARQKKRNAAFRKKHAGQAPTNRGWTREELYERGE
jgi:hypothetical protein